MVVIRPRDSSAVPTLLARPAELSRIGYAVPDDLAALTPPVVPSVRLADGTITGTLAWTLTNFRSAEEPAGTAPQSPTGIPGGDLSVAPEPLTVGITVTTPDGESLDRDLGEVAQTAKGQVPIDAKVLCPDGCRLAALWLRGTDQFTHVIAGHLDLTDLELDGAPLDIGDGANWLPVETPTTDGTQVLSGAGNDLGIEFTNTGRRVVSRWGDVPDPMPVVLAGRPPADADGDDFTLVGLGGRPVASRAVQHVDALPALTNHGALADLDAQLRVGGEVGPGSALQVWLGTESPAVIREVSAALTAGGLPVTSTTTVTEARAQYDRSATGWGLLLGVFTGVMALLVSCLVVGLVAVTSWRGVARDLAGLLVAGTPRTVLRSAVRREQLTTVVAGVLLGTLCGVAGAVLAMPLLPLFDRPAAVPVPDLTPAWVAIVATALLALLLVGGVALLAARGVVARAVPDRLRKESDERDPRRDARPGAHLPARRATTSSRCPASTSTSPPARWSACSARPGSGKSTLLNLLRRAAAARAPAGCRVGAHEIARMDERGAGPDARRRRRRGAAGRDAQPAALRHAASTTCGSPSAAPRAAAPRRDARPSRTRCSTWSGLADHAPHPARRPLPGPAPAAGGRRRPAPPARACCCSTSRPASSTTRAATRCSPPSATSTATSAPRSSRHPRPRRGRPAAADRHHPRRPGRRRGPRGEDFAVVAARRLAAAAAGRAGARAARLAAAGARSSTRTRSGWTAPHREDEARSRERRMAGTVARDRSSGRDVQSTTTATRCSPVSTCAPARAGWSR